MNLGLEFAQHLADADARAKALDAEEVRERDWSDLEAAARDFVKTYGGAAMLRCVSRALEDQKELPL